MAEKKRVLSGMRPTGPLHLGNLHGALANWVAMQPEYDCFYFIADWHALTSDYEDPSAIAGYVRHMVIDWLSAGLAPDQSTLFVQSHIKEHAELYLLQAIDLIKTYKFDTIFFIDIPHDPWEIALSECAILFDIKVICPVNVGLMHIYILVELKSISYFLFNN